MKPIKWNDISERIPAHKAEFILVMIDNKEPRLERLKNLWMLKGVTQWAFFNLPNEDI